MNIARNILKKISPVIIRDVFRYWKNGNRHGSFRPDYPSRNDLKTIDIDGNSRLEVFWKNLSHGKGSAVSLFIKNIEILRIDCFGKDLGHMHIAFYSPSSAPSRLFMIEETVEAQIDRAHFELNRNLRYYQNRIPITAVRNIRIAEDDILRASNEAKVEMNRFLDVIDELSD